MIDEKKLIARLEKQKKFHFERESPFMEYRILTFNEIISIVNELAEEHKIVDLCNKICDKADEILQKGNGGWIPCSERLPDKKEYLKNDGRFIVSDGNRVYHSIYDIYQGKFRTLKIRVRGWVFADDNCVIAWQPLPEHYRAPAAEPTMTNADRIRNMTDEELAKFIRAVGCNSHFGDDCGYPFCHSMEGNLCHGIKDSTDARTLEWLKSEVIKE